ncbi:MAG: BlaI/MecI/CopY family transcriptional regulator [Bacteroidia bacterium]|nr:BlaI/MecI/CopY family transcriptional regulator [Bacteroidia bacterium]
MTPSPAELEILQILWEYEPASVRFVHEKLSETKEVGYTTTLKQMQRMTEKNLIRRVAEGKTHEYEAIIRETQVKKSLFSHLVDSVFKGSAMNLVIHALGNTKPSSEEIGELEKWLEEQKKGGNHALQ